VQTGKKFLVSLDSGLDMRQNGLIDKRVVS